MKNSSCIIQFLLYTSTGFYYATKETNYLLRRFNIPYTRINTPQTL